MARADLENLRIVHYGHPALREKAAPVARVTAGIKALVTRMAEMMDAMKGLGLAANQVGIVRQVAVVVVDGNPTPLVNPEILSAKGSEKAEEGCLSLPRLYGQVVRPTQVVVGATDLTGKRIKLRAEGILARALCHEVDHLNGRLFVDRVDESTLHWLVRSGGDEDPIIQATTLEDALRFFVSAWRGDKR